MDLLWTYGLIMDLWTYFGLMDLLIDLLKSLFTTATRSPLSVTASMLSGQWEEGPVWIGVIERIARETLQLLA